MEFESEPVNETEVERNVKIEDNIAKIDSKVVQEVDLENFMDMFKEKVNNVVKLRRQINNMERQAEQLLEEKNADMAVLHAIDSSDENTQLPEKQQRGNCVNSVPLEAIETYVNLKKAKQQTDQQEDQLEDNMEDVVQLKESAEEIAENYDSFELPENYERALEVIEEHHES